jgi:hypothetical protein
VEPSRTLLVPFHLLHISASYTQELTDPKQDGRIGEGLSLRFTDVREFSGIYRLFLLPIY